MSELNDKRVNRFSLYGRYWPAERAAEEAQLRRYWRTVGLTKEGRWPPFVSFDDFRRWSYDCGYHLDLLLVFGAEELLIGRRVVNDSKTYEAADAWGRKRFLYLADKSLVNGRSDDRVLVQHFRWLSISNYRRRPMKPRLTEEAKRILRKLRRGQTYTVRLHGETLTISALSRQPIAMVSDKIISSRLRDGWSIQDAVATPQFPRGRKERVLTHFWVDFVEGLQREALIGSDLITSASLLVRVQQLVSEGEAPPALLDSFRQLTDQSRAACVVQMMLRYQPPHKPFRAHVVGGRLVGLALRHRD
jgi:hypothetical protein